MNEPLYRHVLFKDLEPYLRRSDYLGGFTTTEQAWIRKNIGSASSNEVLQLLGRNKSITHSELISLIKSESLVPGTLYIISDFLTIYQSTEKNSQGKYISWGNTTNPSEIYTLITMAITNTLLLPSVTIISDNPESIFWSVLYDVTQETLDDGTVTKGKITYLSDNNYNQANFDFKNKLFNINGELRHVFKDDSLCYNNNLCFGTNIFFTKESSNNIIYGDNVIFNVPISNFVGTLNNVKIDTDEINLNNETMKTSLLLDNKYYIDYLDLETLTHLFYALADNIYITL